jgi:YidC/Oxa1 family membrane protein insertase
MFLAFKLSDIVTVPFGWLLNQLYSLLGNYGLAMILFAFMVQMILLPITMKSKKSMMKMSRLQPRIQEIQRKYADDKQKQNEAIQQLQKEEGATMGCGGCLWSLVPLLILLPLFTVIREPIRYLLGESAENATLIVETIKGINPDLFKGNSYYAQVLAAQYIPQYAAQIQATVPGVAASTLEGINFGFLGINLGAQPVFNVFKWQVWNWANIGLFLVPFLSAGSQVLQMWISQKANNSVITDEKGVQDKETAEKSQTAQQSKMMMFMMPLMSLYIGFTVPAGLSLYWFVGGVVRTVQDVILTKHYRKVYDAEDAERLKRYQEQEAIEAEKERVRAERRAANPDGITANTSKKKLQQKQKEEEAAARAAAEAEYLAKKGIVVESVEEKKTLSGIADRPNCKGRAYDPNRYNSTEEEE